MAYPRCHVFKNLRRETGFTLVEMILNIVIMSIMVGVSATVLLSQVNVRARIQYQGEAAADLNYAMRFVRQEIEHIKEGDLIDCSDTAITYINANNEEITLSQGADGSEIALYRNGQVYVPDIYGIKIECYLGGGALMNAAINSMSEVRGINIKIAKYRDQSGGGLTYSALIIPREFIGYKDYE